MKKKTDPKEVKKGCLILIMMALIIMMLTYVTCESEPDKPLTKKELHEQNINKLFSAWDGSHINLSKKIKEALNDPESYEHIKTTYKDLDSILVISTTFTAKNGFGGRLKKEVIATSDTLGNVTSVIKWIDD